MSENNLPEKFANFVIFKTADGKVNIDVYFHDETLWLTQKLIAELFQKDRSVITKHLKNIFTEGELDEKVVCAKFAHTTQHGAIEGKTQGKEVQYYNLRAITAVGYRVNSHRATEFRKWATEILHEYIIKGFVMDDERCCVGGGMKYDPDIYHRRFDGNVYIVRQAPVPALVVLGNHRKLGNHGGVPLRNHNRKNDV